MLMKTTIRLAGWALCAIAGASAFGAHAQDALSLSNAVYQDVQVKAPDGKISVKRIPAAKVVPGGEVVYEIQYANTSKQVVTDVAIDNPVPAQLSFVDVEGTPLTAVSVDGGKTFDKLSALTVTGADGKPRAAQPADVTHLRWVLATLQPGSKGKVAFRARVK